MDTKDLKCFSGKTYYPVYSKQTGTYYIDADRKAYLFQSKREALNSFVSTVPSCFVNDQAETVVQNNQIIKLYAAGASQVSVWVPNEDERIVPLTAKDVPRNTYYNPDLNFHIHLLKETLKKEYLDAMAGDYFFVPVSIPERSQGSYPVIYYVDAFLKDRKSYMVLFSATDEFDKWNKEFRKNCMPLKMNMEKVKSVAGDRDVIINPISDKLFLVNKQIKEIRTS